MARVVVHRAQRPSAVTAARLRESAAVPMPTVVGATSSSTLPRSFWSRNLAHSSRSSLWLRPRHPRRLFLRRRGRLHHDQDLTAAPFATSSSSTSRPVGSPSTTLTEKARDRAANQRKLGTLRSQRTRGARSMWSSRRVRHTLVVTETSRPAWRQPLATMAGLMRAAAATIFSSVASRCDTLTATLRLCYPSFASLLWTSDAVTARSNI